MIRRCSSRIPYPESGCFPIPDSGSRGSKKNNKHRVPDLQHWLVGTLQYGTVLARYLAVSGSVKVWNGSGSDDPSHLLTDPEPALFFSGFKDTNKKKFSLTNFLIMNYWRNIVLKAVLRIRIGFNVYPHPSADADPGSLTNAGPLRIRILVNFEVKDVEFLHEIV